MNGFIEQIDGDWTLQTLNANNVVTIDTATTSLTGNAIIDGDLTVAGNAYLSGNIVGDRIQNGNTIIDIQSYGGNANISVGGVNNVAVFYPEGMILPGNVTAGYFIGNGSFLTDIPTSSGLANGTSNISIATANGNVTISVDGTGNVAVFSSSGLNITGNLSVTGNITGNYIKGDGTELTGVMTDRGSDPNNWDNAIQMGVYQVNRTSWSGTSNTPLDSLIYTGLLEVKNSSNAVIEQNFYPGNVATWTAGNVRTQYNRTYWSSEGWSAWYYVVNNDQIVVGGDF